MESNELVQDNTALELSNKADTGIQESINHYYNDPSEIDARLEELEAEWDTERILALNAGAVSVAGILMSIAGGKKWLALPLLATAFLANHAIKGYCPATSVLKKMGYRTRTEIDKEKYALKALRGDFKYMLDVPNAVWTAVSK